MTPTLPRSWSAFCWFMPWRPVVPMCGSSGYLEVGWEKVLEWKESLHSHLHQSSSLHLLLVIRNTWMLLEFKVQTNSVSEWMATFCHTFFSPQSRDKILLWRGFVKGSDVENGAVILNWGWLDWIISHLSCPNSCDFVTLGHGHCMFWAFHTFNSLNSISRMGLCVGFIFWAGCFRGLRAETLSQSLLCGLCNPPSLNLCVLVNPLVDFCVLLLNHFIIS